MREIPLDENQIENKKKEAVKKAHYIIDKLKTEGLDIGLEEESNTITITLKTVSGGIRKIGLMKTPNFPNGTIEEVIEEWAYRSEETSEE